MHVGWPDADEGALPKVPWPGLAPCNWSPSTSKGWAWWDSEITGYPGTFCWAPHFWGGSMFLRVSPMGWVTFSCFSQERWLLVLFPWSFGQSCTLTQSRCHLFLGKGELLWLRLLIHAEWITDALTDWVVLVTFPKTVDRAGLTTHLLHGVQTSQWPRYA